MRRSKLYLFVLLFAPLALAATSAAEMSLSAPSIEHVSKAVDCAQVSCAACANAPDHRSHADFDAPLQGSDCVRPVVTLAEEPSVEPADAAVIATASLETPVRKGALSTSERHEPDARDYVQKDTVHVIGRPAGDTRANDSEAPRRLVSLFRPLASHEYSMPVPAIPETPNECFVAEICIDDFLWSLYERAPKVDASKVVHRIKAKVKLRGKTRTITRTITRYVLVDFSWKDPIAAQRVGMSLQTYVIGGMNTGFKVKLYRALRMMEAAGLMPGITSAFRDDYRQSIAVGTRAANNSSYHGGSRHGGYGHGLAVDLVSLRGDTRQQRYASSLELWKWIDARGSELGIGRPYLDRDAPHVAPIDGKEYIAKRGRLKIIAASAW